MIWATTVITLKMQCHSVSQQFQTEGTQIYKEFVRILKGDFLEYNICNENAYSQSTRGMRVYFWLATTDVSKSLMKFHVTTCLWRSLKQKLNTEISQIIFSPSFKVPYVHNITFETIFCLSSTS